MSALLSKEARFSYSLPGISLVSLLEEDKWQNSNIKYSPTASRLALHGRRAKGMPTRLILHDGEIQV